MTEFTIGIIGFVACILLLFSGIHIGVIMAITGFFGIAYLRGWEAGFSLVGTLPFTNFANYGLSVIPLFILMGSFCFYAGISKDLYATVHKWLGQFRGGLAMATVAACAAFAAVSGSSLATGATMGTVALPEMKRFKYSPALATGCIAAGGTMGILIPPSVIMVIYGIMTEQSIGKLFMAGFIPGILQAIFYLVTIIAICRLDPSMGPRGPSYTFKEKALAVKDTWIVIVLFLVVIGGLYVGIFSPTEAAGIGACGAFLFALGRRKLNWGTFKASLFETIQTTAMMFLILTGALILNSFLATTRLPFELAEYIGALPLNRYYIIGAMILVYLILGCLMDALAMILLTVPIFFPVILALGFDPIWFGIIIVRMVEIGGITPPVGMNVYVIAGIAKDVPLFTIFRGIVPFLISDFIHVAMLVALPQLALILPSLMKM